LLRQNWFGDAWTVCPKFSSPEMHGFLGAENWCKAKSIIFSGRGAATPKKLSRFFLKRVWGGFPGADPGEMRARRARRAGRLRWVWRWGVAI
jgi:hypothetical protein